MNKRSRTIALMVLVLTIWGILTVKLVGALNGPPSTPEPLPLITATLPEAKIVRDSFPIVADYRDPFLGTLPRKQRQPSIKKKAESTPQKNIEYLGSVAQNGTRKRLFFIAIEGVQHIFEPGQTIAGVRLLSGNENGIRLRYGTRTEQIKRKS